MTALGWAQVPAFRGAMAMFLAANTLGYLWFLGGSRDNRTDTRPAAP